MKINRLRPDMGHAPPDIPGNAPAAVGTATGAKKQASGLQDAYSPPFLPAAIHEILPALGLTEPKRHGDKLRFGKRGSLEIRPRAGDWFSHEAGIGGGVVELVEHVRGCDWRDARRWLADNGFDQYTWEPGKSERQSERSAIAPARTLTPPEPSENALRLWSVADHPAGTLAETYLMCRGLCLPRDPARVIRFHPRCPFGRDDDGRPIYHPCMLTLARNVMTGGRQSIQRTALNPDGSKIGRMALGSMSGAVAMVTPDAETETGIGICEGTEDALMIRQTDPWRPIWATFGTGGLGSFPVLAGIEALTIYADNDDAGRKAKAATATRWADAGRYVEALTPPSKDFNEYLQEASNA